MPVLGCMDCPYHQCWGFGVSKLQAMHLLKAQLPTKAGCFSWHHPLWHLLRETREPPGIPPTYFLSWDLTCFPLEAAHWSREAKWHQERQGKKKKTGLFWAFYGYFSILHLLLYQPYAILRKYKQDGAKPTLKVAIPKNRVTKHCPSWPGT